MKRILLLFTVMLATLSFAQNQKFTYKLTMQKNNKDGSEKKPLEEMVALVVSKEGSLFYNEDKVKADSTIFAGVEKAKGTGNVNLDFSGVKMATFRTVVNKTYPSYATTVMEGVAGNLFEYDETRKPEWKILPEKQKIGEWECQKASLSYLGREWTAWFTSDIPVQDGPYIFHGLPGLIVKVSDSENFYSFELEGVKNKFTVADIKKKRLIKISYDKFRKAYQENYLDPGKTTRAFAASVGTSNISGSVVTTSVRMLDVNGKEVDMKEMERKQNEEAKTRKLSDLNPIDKDLIKE